MKTEFEIKFLSIDKEKIIDKIKKLWWVCTKEETLMKRVVYDKWKTAYARIRDEWDKTTCTYKEISYDNMDINSVKELETEVGDFDTMKAIFDKMWLKQKSYQETLRQVWEINDEIEFMIDTWPGLNPYIEIEWKDEEVVRKYVDLLWFDYNDWVFGTVDEVAFIELWIPKEVCNTISEITFEKPLKSGLYN